MIQAEISFFRHASQNADLDSSLQVQAWDVQGPGGLALSLWLGLLAFAGLDLRFWLGLLAFAGLDLSFLCKA